MASYLIEFPVGEADALAKLAADHQAQLRTFERRGLEWKCKPCVWPARTRRYLRDSPWSCACRLPGYPEAKALKIDGIEASGMSAAEIISLIENIRAFKPGSATQHDDTSLMDPLEALLNPRHLRRSQDPPAYAADWLSEKWVKDWTRVTKGFLRLR